MEEVSRKRKIIMYIKKNLRKGYTQDSLRWALINQGYPKFLVDECFNQAHKEMAQKAPELKEKPKIRYEVYDQQNRPIKVTPKKKSFFAKMKEKFFE